MKKNNQPSTSNVVDNIKKMEAARADRRRVYEEQKQAKLDKDALNKALGRNVDVDFDMLISQKRAEVRPALNHVSSAQMNICVCVRKRPLFEKETMKGEIDVVTVSNPKIHIHNPQFKVDGITKYIQNSDFNFDNAYSEQEDVQPLYTYQIKDLIPSLFNRGVVTLFAYGQTGSGKTFTVSAATQEAVQDMFKQAPSDMEFYMSFFEIYGGKVIDLLNNKKHLAIQEDGNSKIQIVGLTERLASSAQEMNQIIDYGHASRTTRSTAANDTSSRSHAVCQIKVKSAGGGKTQGKLLLVDLAGSERAADCQSNNRQRRMEGAEINKSLLALKECIRALDTRSTHVPFRASKLTMVLRDSFLDPHQSKIVMIACINPGSSSADHTLNTLRYAQRLKQGNSDAYSNPQAVGLMPSQAPTNVAPQAMGQHAYRVNPSGAAAAQLEPSQAAAQQQPRARQASANQDVSPVVSNKPAARNADITRQPASADPLARVNQNIANQRQGSQNNLQREERKRAGWGAPQNPVNPTNDVSPRNDGGAQRVGRPPQNPNSMAAQKRPNAGPRGNVGGGVRNPSPSARAFKETPEHRQAKMDDLRMTLTNNQGQAVVDQNLLTFHEKVDNIMEEQEQLRSNHLEYLKEVAHMITEQGELIQNIQGQDSEDCDIDDYVQKMEVIVARNLQIYTDMQGQLGRFKRLLTEEENAAKAAHQTFHYY